jgi:hypothetical protein
MQVVIPADARQLLSAATVGLTCVNCMLMNAMSVRELLQHVFDVSDGSAAHETERSC